MEIHHGNCLDVLQGMPSESIDSIVTDPPYGLSFMGKRWDYDVPAVEVWAECLRVLKPGGHLLAFAGTRTQHRMAVRIEDAGFEIRDMIAWVYGSGFPKSLDVSKAIDRAAWVEGEYGAPKSAAHAGWIDRGRMRGEEGHEGYQRPWMADADAVDKNARQYIGGTEASRQWQGWGTALKPALEPITVARKPLVGTVAENVLAHGTGALNVDGCRVGTEAVTINTWNDGAKPFGGGAGHEYTGRTVVGRWPANLIHDGSDEVVGLFPETQSRGNINESYGVSGTGFIGKINRSGGEFTRNDSGSAARFFYCAKASKADRDEGLDGFEVKASGRLSNQEMAELKRGKNIGEINAPMNKGSGIPLRRNIHPTVKPTDLMRYLCRLVTPPGGVVLDPFTGSGSTGKAALLEGFRFVGIEREAEYVEIARARIAAVQPRLL